VKLLDFGGLVEGLKLRLMQLVGGEGEFVFELGQLGLEFGCGVFLVRDLVKEGLVCCGCWAVQLPLLKVILTADPH
jgi:hypothetical protein